MTPTDALEALLKSYSFYYDVTRENVEPPFVAEAVFHSHDEQYFLVKSAKLSEAEAHEYVFFATTDHLTLSQLTELDQAAWTAGIARVKPHSSHRNTDVILVVLADGIDPEAAAALRKLRHYQSYKHGFHGWSHFRVIALETSSGKLIYNRMGQPLKKLFRNI
jgi:hypothetical protein